LHKFVFSSYRLNNTIFCIYINHARTVKIKTCKILAHKCSSKPRNTCRLLGHLQGGRAGKTGAGPRGDPKVGAQRSSQHLGARSCSLRDGQKRLINSCRLWRFWQNHSPTAAQYSQSQTPFPLKPCYCLLFHPYTP
jgi:hypothetical protein